jgi:hypothetical protein
VKQVKKAVLIIPVLLLVVGMVLAIVPVGADPSQQIPVTLVTSQQLNSPPEKTWTTDGGILHSQGIVRTGVSTLRIDGQTPIVGTHREVYDVKVNTKTGEAVVQSKFVLTFIVGSTVGTFEDVKQTRTSGQSPIPGLPMTLEQHATLQGAGAFEGQTLMLSQDWEHTSLKHLNLYWHPLIHK